MKNTEEIKKILEEELEVWGHANIIPNVEEKIEDVIGIVKYELYGDQYLVIITNDGCFEYGYYLNLKSTYWYKYHCLRQTEEGVDKGLISPCIAGKIKVVNDRIYEADKFIVTVTKNGVIRRWENNDVRCKFVKSDSWGENMYSISLKQFGYKESKS